LHYCFVTINLAYQPPVLFSQNKPATSNQPAVLLSQNKPAPAISHQPNGQVVGSVRTISMLFVQSISESSLHLNQSGKKGRMPSQVKRKATEQRSSWAGPHEREIEFV
jgi:hypothetical protein